jgi:hypothetical protein
MTAFTNIGNLRAKIDRASSRLDIQLSQPPNNVNIWNRRVDGAFKLSRKSVE